MGGLDSILYLFSNYSMDSCTVVHLVCAFSQMGIQGDSILLRRPISPVQFSRVTDKDWIVWITRLHTFLSLVDMGGAIS
jgi:hypothetical protein